MSDADRQHWNDRYRQRSPAIEEPAAWLRSLADRLPAQGQALDVAGGPGRNAIWLAGRGLDVTVADISEVALGLARSRAEAAGVSIHTQALDFETDPFPAGPWDLVVSINYLWRPLFELIPNVLRPGGMLVFSQPTRSNLLKHERPGIRHLLEDGELPFLVRGLEVVSHSEGWTETGRHEARVLARLPVPRA